jgi:hypothetical protein
VNTQPNPEGSLVSTRATAECRRRFGEYVVSDRTHRDRACAAWLDRKSRKCKQAWSLPHGHFSRNARAPSRLCTHLARKLLKRAQANSSITFDAIDERCCSDNRARDVHRCDHGERNTHCRHEGLALLKVVSETQGCLTEMSAPSLRPDGKLMPIGGATQTADDPAEGGRCSAGERSALGAKRTEAARSWSAAGPTRQLELEPASPKDGWEERLLQCGVMAPKCIRKRGIGDPKCTE